MSKLEIGGSLVFPDVGATKTATNASGVTGTIYYKVVNNICFVYLVNVATTAAVATQSTLTTNLPAESFTIHTFLFGDNQVWMNSGNGTLTFYKNNATTLYGSFCYPVKVS